VGRIGLLVHRGVDGLDVVGLGPLLRPAFPPIPGTQGARGIDLEDLGKAEAWRMRGKWAGFGRDFEVNTGDWELTWVDGSPSKRVLREYHLKL
jgi:hypothetical protein